MRKLLLIVFVLLTQLQLEAKKTENRLLLNTPSDSLVFMFYMNASEIQSDSLYQAFSKEIGEEQQKLLEQFSELNIYAQMYEAHMALTVNFKASKEFDLEFMKSSLSDLDLTITGMQGNFITLQGDGENKRYAYLYTGNQYATLKIFTPYSYISQDIRTQVTELYGLLDKPNMDYEDRNVIYDKVDSLKVLDDAYVEPFFTALIQSDKTRLSNGEDIQSVKRPIKFKQEIQNNPIVSYVKNDEIWRITYFGGIALAGKDMFGSFSSNYDDFKRAMAIYNIFDETWYTAKSINDEIELAQISSNKNRKQNLYTNIDSKMLQYIPATDSANLATYSIDALNLREILYDYYVTDYDKELKLGKLAMLALDDDVVKMLNNFLISGNFVKTSYYGKELHFKAVLKMPNQQKGKRLLDLLCKEFEILQKLEEDTYVFVEQSLTEKPLYLVIDNEYWIAGTHSADELKQKNKNYKTSFPDLLNKKLSSYILLRQDILGVKEGIDNVKIQLELVDSKTVKTTYKLKFSDQLSN